MEEEAYRIEARVERTLWWFRVRRKVLAVLLEGARPAPPPGALVLDLGCGTGANGPVLAGAGRTVVGVDRSRVALRFAGERGAHAFRIAADAAALPFRPGSFDLVAALDVLEHLEDDLGGARELARVARQGGLVLVTVPALRALWGIQDDLSRHVRRYGRRQLLGLLAAAGLAVERATAFNTLLLPPILAARLVLNRLRPRGLLSENEIGGPLANDALEAVFGLELPLLRRFDLPVGVSLAALARHAT